MKISAAYGRTSDSIPRRDAAIKSSTPTFGLDILREVTER
jgi:hypothetical protein